MENIIPDVFKPCLKKTCVLGNVFENMGPGQGPWPKNVETDMCFQTRFENTKYNEFKMGPNEGFQKVMMW